MKGITPEIRSLKDWQKLLARPVEHWKKGYSAYELANAWMKSENFPKLVERLLSNSGFEEFLNLEIDIAYPERKTHLNDDGRPSQTDLMIFATGKRGKVVIAVEGKVDESFDKRVWERNDNTETKKNRLNFLCAELGLSLHDVKNIRYQLLHRTVAPLLEAKKVNARIALMLVHSFSEENTSFEDYQDFLRLFGYRNVEINKIYGPFKLNEINLFMGWVKDKKSP